MIGCPRLPQDVGNRGSRRLMPLHLGQPSRSAGTHGQSMLMPPTAPEPRCQGYVREIRYWAGDLLSVRTRLPYGGRDHVRRQILDDHQSGQSLRSAVQ